MTCLYFVGVKLADCSGSGPFFRFRYVNGRAKGMVCGSGADMKIAAYGNKATVMSHQDDPLVALPFDANQDNFATKFVPHD